MRRPIRAALASAVAVTALVACSSTQAEPDPTATPSETSRSAQPSTVSFLVYGADAEVAAYRTMVDRYNATNELGTTVKLIAVPDRDAALARLRRGPVPDVYLLSRRDLGAVVDGGLNQPVDELLDARGVDFGDYYKRESVRAFSHDDTLECMPYGTSPMVIYYNTNLVDFVEMKAAGIANVPANHTEWTFDQFAEAARFGSRFGAKGVYVEPSLQGLAPFVYSGGGQMFDDEKDPSRLALADGQALEALTTTLELLRQEEVAPTAAELRQQDALTRFKEGKLGMIAGFRTLVPELRKAPGLSFDVMPMPMIGEEKTVGDVSGLCIAASTASTAAAADFVVHAIGKEAVSEVAEAGYLVPANIQVAESNAFRQRDRMPVHSYVFNRSVRDIVTPPLIESYAELEDAVHQSVYQLFYRRVIDIEALTEQVDEKSKAVLSPPEPTATPTP